MYRFTADDGHEGLKDAQRRLTGTTSRIDFNVVSVSTCRTITVSGVRVASINLGCVYRVALSILYDCVKECLFNVWLKSTVI